MTFIVCSNSPFPSSTSACVDGICVECKSDSQCTGINNTCSSTNICIALTQDSVVETVTFYFRREEGAEVVNTTNATIVEDLIKKEINENCNGTDVQSVTATVENIEVTTGASLAGEASNNVSMKVDYQSADDGSAKACIAGVFANVLTADPFDSEVTEEVCCDDTTAVTICEQAMSACNFLGTNLNNNDPGPGPGPGPGPAPAPASTTKGGTDTGLIVGVAIGGALVALFLGSFALRKRNRWLATATKRKRTETLDALQDEDDLEAYDGSTITSSLKMSRTGGVALVPIKGAKKVKPTEEDNMEEMSRVCHCNRQLCVLCSQFNDIQTQFLKCKDISGGSAVDNGSELDDELINKAEGRVAHQKPSPVTEPPTNSASTGTTSRLFGMKTSSTQPMTNQSFSTSAKTYSKSTATHSHTFTYQTSGEGLPTYADLEDAVLKGNWTLVEEIAQKLEEAKVPTKGLQDISRDDSNTVSKIASVASYGFRGLQWNELDNMLGRDDFSAVKDYAAACSEIEDKSQDPHCSDKTSEELQSITKRAESLLATFAPQEVHNVPLLMREFSGREELLIEQLSSLAEQHVLVNNRNNQHITAKKLGKRQARGARKDGVMLGEERPSTPVPRVGTPFMPISFSSAPSAGEAIEQKKKIVEEEGEGSSGEPDEKARMMQELGDEGEHARPAQEDDNEGKKELTLNDWVHTDAEKEDVENAAETEKENDEDREEGKEADDKDDEQEAKEIAHSSSNAGLNAGVRDRLGVPVPVPVPVVGNNSSGISILGGEKLKVDDFVNAINVNNWGAVRVVSSSGDEF